MACSLNPTRRAALNAALLSTLLIVVLAMLAGGLWYASPRRATVMIGSLSDFPPCSEPYPIMKGEIHAWVVNTDGEIVVFDSRTPGYQRCRTKWSPPNQAFEDPCSGARYLISGEFCYGPPTRDLDRFTHSVIDGEIWIEPWAVPGAPNDRDATAPYCRPAGREP